MTQWSMIVNLHDLYSLASTVRYLNEEGMMKWTCSRDGGNKKYVHKFYGEILEIWKTEREMTG
jgi:hypothetical protein